MAYAAPLMRTNTAPLFPANSGGILSSMTSGATRASQLSGSTAYGSSSTSLASLSSATTAVPPTPGAGVMSAGGPVVATANIINQKADASRSLYQICVSLKTRLGQVPDFDEYLYQLEQEVHLGPVESLWNLLRTGHPLLSIYNAIQPTVPLRLDDQPPAPGDSKAESRRQKLAVFKFVQACLKELNIPPAECFVINDLLGNDTSGFVKVTSVVNYVLDIAEQRGFLLQLQPYPEDELTDTVGSQMSYRDHIVKELVDTERKYVQDLENLHDLKKTLEEKGVIPGDIVHQIFLNINAILDFQRRFLIRVETTNSMPPDSQQWGAPFAAYEEAFMIYQPFIANQRKAAQIANQVFDKIQQADHPVAIDFNTLDGFLLKPMQRLVKYPLLLKDLRKKSEDEAAKADLTGGIDSAERVLQQANKAVDQDLLDEAVEDLIQRVDDWKNHKVEQFGRLMLHGVYTVVTGKSEQEKDYEIYLFECILLCCKEVQPNKSKDKKDKTKSVVPKARNRNAKLQLKGRIFMTNVTEVVSLSKPGSYSVQIWWKGDPGVENFTIKFSNEEMMRKWASGLDTQRKENAPRQSSSPDTQNLDFNWMKNQPVNNIENPYMQPDDDDDDDQLTGGFNGSLMRNPSSTSLRQRSATGESTQSLAGIARGPPPRFPIPAPAPLSLQTQQPSGSPVVRPPVGDSYFSPVAESPVSSRTSTTSGMFQTPTMGAYPFPKTGTPQSVWDDNNRYTAPAVARAPSREGPSPGYGMNGRNPRGPSLPVMNSNNQSAAQQQRSRSYSTPDINGPPGMRRTHGGTPQVPAVPGIPAHLHHDANIPRSNTGSPRQDLPIRSSTQSPGAQRERMHQSSASYGGQMGQFPAGSLYRQNTPGPPGQQMTMVDAANMMGRTVSPPLAAATQANPLGVQGAEMPLPTQLKVKVQCDSGNYVTLVVAFNITYQSLIDRIDAKLARFTASSIGRGNLKLRYRDEDGDFVSIESDDDIQIAFMEWREGVRNMYSGGVGEIELYCVGDMG